MYAYTYVHVLYKLVLVVQKHIIHYYFASLCLVALIVQVHINLGLLPILAQLYTNQYCFKVGIYCTLIVLEVGLRIRCGKRYRTDNGECLET